MLSEILQSALDKLIHGSEKREWGTDLSPEECVAVLDLIEEQAAKLATCSDRRIDEEKERRS